MGLVNNWNLQCIRPRQEIIPVKIKPAILKIRYGGIDFREGTVSANLLLGVLSTSLLLYPACGVEQTGGSPVNPDDSATQAIRHERQMYQNRVQANLNDLDRRIAALEVRLRNREKGAEKRAQLISGLDRKRACAFQKLQGLRTSSHEAWGDMKAGIDSAMDELEIAYQRANSNFK